MELSIKEKNPLIDNSQSLDVYQAHKFKHVAFDLSGLIFIDLFIFYLMPDFITHKDSNNTQRTVLPDWFVTVQFLTFFFFSYFHSSFLLLFSANLNYKEFCFQILNHLTRATPMWEIFAFIQLSKQP